MKKIIIMIMVVCMLLCACSKAPAEQTTDAANNTTAAIVTTEATMATEATQATEETTAPTATEETVPVVLYRNPLNGTPLDEPHTARPYAVVINNIVYAQPLCGVGSADIVIELLAEGGITRCLAIFGDIKGLDHIGAVRSARPYLAELACSFDAIFVHHGGSVDGYSRVRELGITHLDFLGNAGSSYYRDQNRLDSGYDLEHTSFTDGDDLLETVADLEYKTDREEGVDYGFAFDDVGSTVDGDTAVEMKVVFGSKMTTLTYNEATGCYTAMQYGDNIVDGNTDELVSYRNVLMLNTETYTYENNDGFRVHMDLVGEGTGYFACDGKVVPICWSRSGDYESFVFTHEDGTPITFGVGSTYIAITPLDSVLEY